MNAFETHVRGDPPHKRSLMAGRHPRRVGKPGSPDQARRSNEVIPVTINDILMHPAVSRAMQGLDRTPALDELVALRKARRDVKRAAANMREEIAVYGASPDAWDSGQICQMPAMPGNRRLGAALAADGLPPDLRRAIHAYFASFASTEVA